MTEVQKNQPQNGLQEARESFSGRLLSDAQFDEAIAITGILEREIIKSGSFKDKLGDYSYAMARSERIDALKAETIIRDLFKMRTGQTMNQMREKLMEREDKLPSDAHDRAYSLTAQIGEVMEAGDKIAFHRAFSAKAQELGEALAITDAKAKTLMRESFKETEGRELIEWGKELDEQIFKPQIDSEKKQRAEASDDTASNARTNLRGRAPQLTR